MSDTAEAEEPWLHVTFRYPVRLLLQGRSTPVVAVNAQIASTNGASLTLRVRQIYASADPRAPVTAMSASGTVIVQYDNIAGRVQLKELPK